ncbi:DUF4277 domain-containing protein [uncultured Desulfobacter sp.]|uniref:DUF4277 domain-containing protein n=1 Tax=uncultured Desulfobacter sp. TaxID=240139 RepID=UPI00374A43B6
MFAYVWLWHYFCLKIIFNHRSELLLGKTIAPGQFNDTNLGRAMDQLFHAGTHKIFSQLSQNAIGCFKLDTRYHHFDTTSVSVFGDYDHPDQPLNITYGYSKAKRPDLKQFMVSMLCVDRNIPIIGKTQDGKVLGSYYSRTP